MIVTDALKYVPQMGLDPLRVVSGAAAKRQNPFALAKEFAAGTTVGEKVLIVFSLSS